LDEPVVINRDSPQASGLRLWIPPIGSPGAGAIRNPAYGAESVSLGTGVFWVSDPVQGLALDFGTAKTNERLFVTGLSDVSGSIYTLTAWVMIRTYDTSGVVLWNDGGRFWQTVSDTQVFHAGTSITVSSTNFDDSAWHLHVFTSDGTTRRYYFDGIELGNLASVASIPAGSKTFELGHWPGGGGTSWTLDGRYGDARLYTRALSPADIWQLYDPATRWQLYAPTRQFWIVSAALTAVGSEVNSDWNVNSSVGLSQTHDWHVHSAVGLSRDSDWNILSSVGLSQTHDWHTYSTIGLSNTNDWHVYSAVGQESDNDWHVLAAVGLSRASDWHIYSFVGDSFDSEWNVESEVELTEVGQEFIADWNIIANVAKNVNIDWNTLFAIGLEYSSNWHVYSVVTQNINTDWNTLFAIGLSRSVDWNTLLAVGLSHTSEWHIARAINQTVIAEWNVAYAVLTAAQDSVLAWNIIEFPFAGSNVVLAWHVAPGDIGAIAIVFGTATPLGSVNGTATKSGSVKGTST
jgi:hypothetical protein